MARKPRVFVWSDGFRRYLVATTSRAKALDAWGFDRDLFREGAATEVESGPGYDDAMAEPGAVIELDVSEAVAKAKVKTPPKAAKTHGLVERGPSKAELARRERRRRRVADLEARLDAAERARLADRRALDERREALEDEIETAEAGHRETIRKLKADLAAARRDDV